MRPPSRPARGRARREDRLPQPRRRDRRGRDGPARRPGRPAGGPARRAAAGPARRRRPAPRRRRGAGRRLRRRADARGRRPARRRRFEGDGAGAGPGVARPRRGVGRPGLSIAAGAAAPRRAARPGPLQRHEDARARRLGRAAGRPDRLAPARLPRAAARDGAAAPRLGPPGRRGRGRLAIRWPTTRGRVLGRRVPVRAIHNGVDVDRFHPGPGDGPALDRAAGLPEAPAGTVRVGLVATFATWKGHERLPRRRRPDPGRRPGAVLRRRRADLPDGRVAGLDRRPAGPGRGGWASAIASASRATRPTRPRRSGRSTWSSTRARGPSRSGG